MLVAFLLLIPHNYDVINFFYEDENTLKSDLNDLNFTNILSRIQMKLKNSTLIDISNFLKEEVELWYDFNRDFMGFIKAEELNGELEEMLNRFELI